jgi:hypothetical protein
LGKGIPKHTFWEKVYQNIPFGKRYTKTYLLINLFLKG